MNTVSKKLLSLAILGTSAQLVHAQNEIDALRYSQTPLTGTARSIGLGGAMGAVGGDFSSISINPAAIGVYRSSEISVTPTLKLNNVSGTYFGDKQVENSAKMLLTNAGLVFTNAAKGSSYNKRAWKSFSFGVGYNRVADFNSSGNFLGNNSISSITEEFAEDAKRYGTNPNSYPPYGAFAWDGFLTDNDTNSIVYRDIISKGGSVNQSKSWERKGGINEWNLTFGGNFKEKLLIGGSINILAYKYRSSTNYYEADATGNKNNNFDYLNYNEIIQTEGTGFNFKLGALYNVSSGFRIGANVQSPTWIALSDNADYAIVTETEGLRNSLGFAGTRSTVQPDQPLYFEYNLRTPWKFGVNAMAFLGKYGFISADYEYAAQNTMFYNFGSNYVFQARSVNQNISNTFKETHTIRVGAEVKLQNFMVRAGVSYITSPFQNDKLFEGSRTNIGGGFGMNMKSSSINLAYAYSINPISEFGYPITYSNIPVEMAKIKNNFSYIALTYAIKF